MDIPAMKIPELVIEDSSDEMPIHIGLPELRFDGEPIPWPTVGEWSLSFGDSDAATLHVSFPVRVRVRPRAG